MSGAALQQALTHGYYSASPPILSALLVVLNTGDS